MMDLHVVHVRRYTVFPTTSKLYLPKVEILKPQKDK